MERIWRVTKRQIIIVAVCVMIAIVGTAAIVQAAARPVLNSQKLSLEEGHTKTLKIKKVKKNKIKKKMFQSSKNSVAKVTADGEVTGVKQGKATITCKLTLKNKKKYTLKCKVTVKSDSQEGEIVEVGYHTQEIWCKNGQNNIYGIAYIPESDKPMPLIIFSHELGNSHTSGIRYAEQLAKAGYAAYVFDFCGGSAPGTENRSDGTNSEMSVMTEVSDLEAVMETAKTWDFVDADRVFLLGGSQGGLVTAIAGNRNQDQIAGMMLMYPALSAKDDMNIGQYATQEDVPSEINLFGGWMRVGKNYVTDIWNVDFYDVLSSYEGEMLLLHGNKDATVPLTYSEEAKNVIPHCEFHVIEGGGHGFYGQPFEDAMGYILSYIQTQLETPKEEAAMNTIRLFIGEEELPVKWEENESVNALKEIVKGHPLQIQMSMYGGFEQVGAVGANLPRHDVQTTTNAGDIVLYSGNQIVIFYGSNSWAYTRLGKIMDVSMDKISELLGNGDVMITLSE